MARDAGEGRSDEKAERKAELVRVKRELATVTMKHNILKKLMVYFEKESR